jgi:hypothetical protein
MKRSLVLVVAVVGMVVVAAVAVQDPPPPLVTTWASNAEAQTPVVAVLIEMGVKDANVHDWSGRATLTGAKLVRREGYRFQTGDQLLDETAWKVKSHRAVRAPKGKPAVSKIEPLASVGIVLHLANAQEGARLAITLDDKEAPTAEVALKDVLAGQVQELWNGSARIRLLSTADPLATGKTEDDFPAAAYGPDGTLWVAYISYTVKEDQRRIEAPTLKKQPENFKAYFTPEPGDQLFVKYYRGGKWSAPIAVTGPIQDLARCAIAADKVGNGTGIWVVYSAQRDGNFDLYGRTVISTGPTSSLSPEARITSAAGPDITPAMCTAQDGSAWLACQSWGDDGQARISVLRRDSKGLAKRMLIEGKKGENCWHPAIAADNTGKVAVAYDIFRDGDYDVHVAIFDGTTGKRSEHVMAGTRKAEMRPSVAYQNDRLWLAYEEGPENWGQDSGALVRGKGEPLYSSRSVRVVCLEADGTLKRPVADLPTSPVKNAGAQFNADLVQKYESGVRYAYPKLGVDLKGRLWLAYRQSSSSRYSSHPGSYWLTYVRRLGAKTWSEPIEVHHADGLLDHRPVLLPHRNGGLLLIHNTDGRYTTPEIIANQVYTSVVDLPGGGEVPERTEWKPAPKPASAAAAAERAAVARIRAYRINNGGTQYRILRGEYHRHTEISWDGGADGSLEDMFRYAIDAAGMDWIGNGDHDNGAGREYPWWLTQKFTDAYHVANVFTPMFTYERSVGYPHGHRNCMFAQRGVRTLPRLAPPAGTEKPEGGVHPDDTKMLYRYLKEFDGICAVHTSASSMGTDWRDNDPVVEPIVEIYQGDRMSYEMEEAPRAGYDPKLAKEPANIAGWFPKGFINNAFQKGYRLGFQASSDHWSTHISYFMVLAEKHDRQGILDAVKKRHVYGATDNIIALVRSGPHIMGDAFKTRQAPTLQIHVLGTSDLAKIDILRDSKVTATLKPQGTGYTGTWTDPSPLEGTHYYYIRVMQKDNELAWGSPMWIHFEK